MLAATGFVVFGLWARGPNGLLAVRPDPDSADYAEVLYTLGRDASGIGEGQTDLWPQYLEIIQILDDACEEVPGARIEEADGSVKRVTKFTEAIAKSAAAQAAAPADVERAAAVWHAMLNRGLLDKLDRFAAAGGLATRPKMSTPLIDALCPDWAMLRETVRGLSYAADRAWHDGEEESAMSLLGHTVVLGRIMTRQPMLLDRLVGQACWGVTLQRARESAVARRPSYATSARMIALCGNLQVPSFRVVADGERVIAADAIVHTVARGSLIRARSQGDLIAKLDEFTEVLHALADQGGRPLSSESVQRFNSFDDEVDERYPMLRTLMPAWAKALLARDQFELLRVGTSLMFAIEAHAALHGEPPSQLAEIDPIIVKTVPLDPLTGLPFGYTRIDAAQDPAGRGYLLYSVGRDMEDNGGKRSPKDAFGPLGIYAKTNIHGRGYDFVINEP